MNAQPSDASELGAVTAAHEEGGPAPGAGSSEETASPRAEKVEPTTADPKSEEPEKGADEAPTDLAAVIAERDAYLADLQRVTAEFTNFRRQTMKRNTDLVAQAASRLAKQLLVVLDTCEAAVNQGVEGIDAVQAQLLGVLSSEGLAVLGTVDEPFDPGFHEAVMSEDSDEDGQAAPVVAEVLRTGYAWNGRVLRPAMVRVRG